MPAARPLLLALIAAVSLLAFAAGAAQGQTFFECSDFTPASVRDACDRAVPIECRGPDAPRDFGACLRENGTSQDEVAGLIDAAQRAAGIPVGGVDTGFGGLAVAAAPPPGEDRLPAAGIALALAVMAAVVAIAARRRSP